MTWLSWRDLDVRREGRRLLKVDDLRLEGPGLVLVLGATGSGKSTLLRSATRQEAALEHCDVTGDVAGPAEATAGYLPQDAMDAFLAADLEGEYALRARGRGLGPKQAGRWARERLAHEGLAAQAHAPLASLSAGGRKRAALAAIQAHEPQALLLDEPFTHLDGPARASLVAQIGRLAAHRLVLVATHEPRALLPSAARCLVLRQGRLAFDGTPDELPGFAARAPELVLDGEEPLTQRAVLSSQPLLRLQGFGVHRGGRRALDRLDASFGAGVHTIEGDNGAGKSTLLRAIQGMEPYVEGEATVAGAPADGRRSTYLIEEPTAGFFASTVRDEILFGLRREPNGCDVRARLREALADFDLEGMADRHPYTLSGGERTRLALACLDALRRPVMLLDEPTAGLDGLGRAALRYFLHRRRPDHCILLATHDATVAGWGESRHRLERGRWASEVMPPRTSP